MTISSAAGAASGASSAVEEGVVAAERIERASDSAMAPGDARAGALAEQRVLRDVEPGQIEHVQIACAASERPAAMREDRVELRRSAQDRARSVRHAGDAAARASCAWRASGWRGHVSRSDS